MAPLVDLELTKTHDGTFGVGQPGEYELTVTNHGPSVASGPLVVVDTLPAGLTFASATGEGWACTAAGPVVTCTYTGADLAVDASTTVTLTVEVGTAAEGEVTNTATVSGPAEDPDPTNDTDEDPTTVDPVADLSVDKSHEGDLLVGEEAQWVIDVANAGPSISRGPITVTDTVPDGIEVLDAAGDGWTCEVAGQDVTCTRTDDLPIGPAPTITVTVVPQPGIEGEVTNTATVTGTTTDPDPANDTDDDTAAVLPSVDLSLTKVLLDDQLVDGADVTWRIIVANAGPSDATEVTVVDVLPPELRYVSASGGTWACISRGSDGHLHPRRHPAGGGGGDPRPDHHGRRHPRRARHQPGRGPRSRGRARPDEQRRRHQPRGGRGGGRRPAADRRPVRPRSAPVASGRWGIGHGGPWPGPASRSAPAAARPPARRRQGRQFG